MAEGKKSFVLYADLIDNIDHLTNEEKGILFNHLLMYVNDMNPVLEDRLILTAWKPIQRQLKRDLSKYENSKEERSRSGKLGNLKKYHSDLYDRVKSEELTLKTALAMAETRKASHSDTKLAVNVNDNVNVNVNDTQYAESVFLENWSTCRQHYLKQPTNIKNLNFNERNLFTEIKNEYNKEEINDAMKTLFSQERIPVDAMVLRPKHFLEKFDTYYTGKNNTKIYGSNV